MGLEEYFNNLIHTSMGGIICYNLFIYENGYMNFKIQRKHEGFTSEAILYHFHSYWGFEYF